MAVLSNKVTVTTTAQVIASIDNVTQYVHLHSKGASYIGNTGVTTTNGFLLDNGDKLVITVPAGCELNVVGAMGTHDLYVLTTRVD